MPKLIEETWASNSEEERRQYITTMSSFVRGTCDCEVGNWQIDRTRRSSEKYEKCSGAQPKSLKIIRCLECARFAVLNVYRNQQEACS